MLMEQIDPRREAASLLAFTLNTPSSFLIAHPEYELTGDEAARFGIYVTRRANREPFQYITGQHDFYGLEFAVTPDVLIPRPETEILVEEAIKELRKLNELKKFALCEVGVGSGCISVSIRHNIPSATAVAIDISEKALAVAKRNTERHGVADRLSVRMGNGYGGVSNRGARHAVGKSGQLDHVIGFQK